VDVDRQSASDLLMQAEQSTDVNARRYLGVVYEAIDWRKALANYDYAAKQGQQDAAARACTLRKRLKNQGLLPKTVIDRLMG
jgi:TPR repeat protein